MDFLPFKVFNQILAFPDLSGLSKEYDVWSQVQTLQVEVPQQMYQRSLTMQDIFCATANT